MNSIQKTMSPARLDRTGHFRAFTLIEMLIAVTLVLLMMVLFAEIFSLAADSMNLQRGISENDQQVRTLTTVLRNDLQKRTFRNCVPFFPGESIDDENSSYSFGNRAGYFYLSTNDPVNGRDNVLQFTIRSTERDGDPNETPYFGAATTLPGNFLQNPNQPEHDDGDISPNGAMSSSAAEVCYFLRGDKLYRRQLLLREPLPSSGATNPQPTRQIDGALYFGNSPVIYTGEFLRDFDLSAIGSPSGAILLGVESLNNESATTLPLGQSVNRFGFSQVDGLSREFGDSTGTFFIGRFTHEETSADNFKFPQSLTEQQGGGTLGNGIPYDAVNTPVTDARDIFGNAVADGIVDEFEEDIPGAIAAGTRRGEDLLLTNVHEFTVKVWDDRLQTFVPIAHSLNDTAGIPGDFNVARQLNSGYAPIGGSAAIFDTWHQSYDRNGDSEDANGNGTLDAGEDTNSNGILDLNPDLPPFLPMRWDPLGVSGILPTTVQSTNHSSPDSHWAPATDYYTEDANANGRLDPGEDGTNGFPANNQLDGDIIFPRTEDINYNGILDSGEDGSVAGIPNNVGGPRIDSLAAANSWGRSFAYQCIQSGQSGPVGSDEPNWSATLEREENNVPAGTTPARWRAIPNRVPLKAIQVTVRFLHVQTNKMRQITLVHSMTAN